MKKILLILLFIPAFAFSQTGIRFEHGLSWKDIQAKAKAEKKYIFVDAFTTWCGPCRYMAANIYPKEEVGKVFNQNFINVKAQLDSTNNDDAEVKNWYNDAHHIMVKYRVNAFPTYLFFDPNGKLVHRSLASSEADKFILKAQDAVNPDKQYYTMLDKYKAGKKDPDFLRKLAYASQEAFDMENAKAITKDYLSTQKDLFTKDNLEFINRFTESSGDEGFKFIMNNAKKFDEVMGAGAAGKKIEGIVMYEEVFPKIFKHDAATPDWNAISAALNDKYPSYAKEILSGSKVAYYQNKGDWNNFETAVVEYMKNYGANASPEQLNNFAWTVFENCKDMTCVTEALSWSKRSFKDKENPMFIDTYANILYKLGKKDEAIKWEEKAVALQPGGENNSYKETLNKMKNGEKTWKD